MMLRKRKSKHLSSNNTDRNPVRLLLEFSTKAAFPSTTLESLVLDWEVK